MGRKTFIITICVLCALSLLSVSFGLIKISVSSNNIVNKVALENNRNLLAGSKETDSVDNAYSFSIPLNLSAAAISSSEIDLRWNASDDNQGIQGYEVYRNNELIGTVESPAYIDSTLASNTAYGYFIRAFDAAGDKSEKSGIIECRTLPDKVRNISVTAGTTSVILTWDKTDEATYEVEEDGNIQNTDTNPKYIDVHLQPATSHSYRVRASNTGGCGEWSPTINVVTHKLSKDPFIEINGMVVIESEHYTDNISRGSHNWVLCTSFDGYSGEGAMQASPNNDASWMKDYSKKSPELIYKVNFSTTGRYFIWHRCYGIDDHSDSVHVGLDGKSMETSGSIVMDIGQYNWLNRTYTWARAYIDILKTGIHEINLWAREDGSITDKILLTTDPDYKPAGIGPDESPRSNYILTPRM